VLFRSGDSECDGKQYCVGDPKYIECNSWNTDCGICCKCDGGTQANPTENYDETQDGDCDSYDKSEVATCDWIPDNYHFTWDYHFAIDSICEALDTCTHESGYYEYTHICNDDDLTDTVTNGQCGAYCDENLDCNNECNGKQWYSTYICNLGTCYCDVSSPICSVGHCNAECDGPEDCGNKCIGEVRYHSGTCDLSSTCSCSYSTEDCNTQDGCYAYDTGCEDRNYSCTPGSCDYIYSNRNTDYNDDWVYYCSDDNLKRKKQLHDFYCDGLCSDHTSWPNDELVEDCNNHDCTTPYPLSCVGVGTSQIKETGDDYSCSSGICSIIGTKDCSGPWICDSGSECSSQFCGGSSYTCYNQNGWVWGTPPTTEMNCDDNYDNDCDGFIDGTDLDCAISNNPPYPPIQPSGNTSGFTGVRYTYSTNVADPDGDKIISYIWNWGDGRTSSTKKLTASHAWRNPGTYQVYVKAKDEHGAISERSPILYVTITKSPHRQINWKLIFTTCFISI
jgi:hypothetical protein